MDAKQAFARIAEAHANNARALDLNAQLERILNEIREAARYIKTFNRPPEASIIVRATDREREHVVSALRSLGFDVESAKDIRVSWDERKTEPATVEVSDPLVRQLVNRHMGFFSRNAVHEDMLRGRAEYEQKMEADVHKEAIELVQDLTRSWGEDVRTSTYCLKRMRFFVADKPWRQVVHPNLRLEAKYARAFREMRDTGCRCFSAIEADRHGRPLVLITSIDPDLTVADIEADGQFANAKEIFEPAARGEFEYIPEEALGRY